jgi:hypothetical protein
MGKVSDFPEITIEEGLKKVFVVRVSYPLQVFRRSNFHKRIPPEG